MIRRAGVAALAALACGPGAAQTAPEAELAPQGAMLRGLDRMAGESQDFALAPGTTTDFGHLRITLHECRYPAGEPLADAFAHVTIANAEDGAVLFSGWMIASSPALSALDHPRYDLWVLGCRTAAGAEEPG
jgi:hypothetical protein